jgi:uncharacterized protein (TIGR00725 family)
MVGSGICAWAAATSMALTSSDPLPHHARRRPTVAICGSGAEDSLLNQQAEEVGRLLAAAAVDLVCGGLGGVMAAACRGAFLAGGLTIGILPGNDSSTANPFVQIAVPTGMGHARNVIIVQTADVVIAVGGEYGTLSEIALARKAGRPVIGLGTWSLGSDPDGNAHVQPAATPATAVELALAYLRPR